MKSIRELYKIGSGPSSSHTIGPQNAARWFAKRYPSKTYYVTLYGSLAATGKGHLTDYIIKKFLHPGETIISWFPDEELPRHPNAMKISDGTNEHVFYSIGGGSLKIEGFEERKKAEIYPEKNFDEIKKWCLENNKTLADYCYNYEDKNIKSFLYKIWNVSKISIDNGLKTTGVLGGGLEVRKKAKELFDSIENENFFNTDRAKENAIISAYALAVSEENASGKTVVTSPTCGASGILPAVLKFAQKRFDFTDEEIIKAIAVAGVVGNVVKHNASISGAEAGCQAEVGTACSMAAAAYATLLGFDMKKLEAAIETALEHHLGLTCDPVLGLVQIPCIERNAVAALRAIDACDLSHILYRDNKVSFDQVVKTMYETGKDMNKNYRETSRGGLAKNYY